MNPIHAATHNGVEHIWEHLPGDYYVVTGRFMLTGRKFRRRYSQPGTALGINESDVRVWLVRHGKRVLVKQTP